MNTAGAVVQRMSYDPNGAETRVYENALNPQQIPAIWTYTFEGARADVNSLIYLDGHEMDTASGQILQEDPQASIDNHWAASIYATEESPIPDSIADPHGIWRWVGYGANLTLLAATAGGYAEVLGTARGLATFAGLAAGGAVIGGGVSYEMGGSVAKGAWTGLNITTGLGTFSPKTAANLLGIRSVEGSAAGLSYLGGQLTSIDTAGLSYTGGQALDLQGNR